nr:eukaryotic translation initiation factor 3 subunit A-like [Leptinotarsa decemlineata]
MQEIKSLQIQQAKFEEEKKTSNKKLKELSSRIKNSEEIIEERNESIRRLEASLNDESENALRAKLITEKVKGEEMMELKCELSRTKKILTDLESKLVEAEKYSRNLKNQLSSSRAESYKIIMENQRQIKQMEIDSQNEKIKLAVNKIKREKEEMNKEMELQGSEDSDSYSTVSEEIRKYDELAAKYEILEEEHVITKAKLVAEKESSES